MDMKSWKYPCKSEITSSDMYNSFVAYTNDCPCQMKLCCETTFLTPISINEVTRMT